MTRTSGLAAAAAADGGAAATGAATNGAAANGAAHLGVGLDLGISLGIKPVGRTIASAARPLMTPLPFSLHWASRASRHDLASC